MNCYFTKSHTLYSERALEKEREKVTKLRDAIAAGLVKEIAGDCLRGEGVTFPVEDGATEIFIRDFYPIFFNYFLEEVISDSACPGIVARGPPGVGKVVT